MGEPGPDHREKEGTDLGQIVSQCYERRLSDESSSRSSRSFGRYLQAARYNAGLSVTELAHRAKIPTAALLALEQGFFAAADIQPKWLKRLAAALGENVEDFHLILGSPAHLRPSIFRQFREWLFGFPRWRTAPKSPQLLRPLYRLGSVLLICIAIATLINYAIFSSPPQSPEQIDPFIYISTERRLNMIKAETLLEYQLINLSSAPRTTTKPCCVN